MWYNIFAQEENDSFLLGCFLCTRHLNVWSSLCHCGSMTEKNKVYLYLRSVNFACVSIDRRDFHAK